jgi:hypothetical protein
VDARSFARCSAARSMNTNGQHSGQQAVRDHKMNDPLYRKSQRGRYIEIWAWVELSRRRPEANYRPHAYQAARVGDESDAIPLTH